MSSKLNYLLLAPKLVFNIMGSRSRALCLNPLGKPDWFVNRPQPAYELRHVSIGRHSYEETGVYRQRFVCTIGRAA